LLWTSVLQPQEHSAAEGRRLVHLKTAPQALSVSVTEKRFPVGTPRGDVPIQDNTEARSFLTPCTTCDKLRSV